MARIVNDGFDIFHGWLTPNTTESEAAKSHRASIEACLKSNFEITRFFRTGSFGNGTSICNYSDVDYFASIPTKNLHQNSSTTLRVVKEALQARFPNSGVYVDAPAVVLPFGSDAAEATEVVPADYIEVDSQGNLVYEIPDRVGGWMRASPDAHNAYVAAINDRLSKKVKPLVRFIKAWKYYCNVPISSFYIELWVARYAATQSVILYSIDVKNIFEGLWNTQLAAIPDPKGVAGYISPCNSEAKKQEAVSKLCTAFVRASNAREAEEKAKIVDAFFWWNLLYNDKFPVYG